MAKLSYADLVIFKAVAYIETSRLSGLQANTKTLAHLLSGKYQGPYCAHLAQQTDFFGALPKINSISVISHCSILVETGYLTRQRSEGNFYFSTTGNDPFESEELLFTDKLPARKRKLVETIRQFVLGYCSNLQENEQKQYLGFRLQPTDDSFRTYNYNWFWITGSDKGKQFAYRFRPDLAKRGDIESIDFGENDVGVVISKIKSLLNRNEAFFSLTIDRAVEYEGLPKRVKQSLDGQETLQKTVVPNSSERGILTFDHFIDTDTSAVVLNHGNNQMNALLSVGDASPFFFFDRTYFSGDDAKKLADGKRSFDFSMRKWKLVAWTVSRKDDRSVREAIVLNKKTRTIWMILSIVQRRVLCVSRAPIEIKEKDVVWSVDAVLDLLFAEKD